MITCTVSEPTTKIFLEKQQFYLVSIKANKIILYITIRTFIPDKET